jgi:Cu+-exporting ATPase
MTKLKVTIEGMHCGSCAAGIQMLLSSAIGVKEATVDYDAKTGEVEIDESKITSNDVLKYINDLGYQASVSE